MTRRNHGQSAVFTASFRDVWVLHASKAFVKHHDKTSETNQLRAPCKLGPPTDFCHLPCLHPFRTRKPIPKLVFPRAQAPVASVQMSAEASGPGVLGVTSSTPPLPAVKAWTHAFFASIFPPPARLRLILPHESAFVCWTPSLFAVFWRFFGSRNPTPPTPPPRFAPFGLKRIT